jgi:hypothetical protein
MCGIYLPLPPSSLVLPRFPVLLLRLLVLSLREEGCLMSSTRDPFLINFAYDPRLKINITLRKEKDKKLHFNKTKVAGNNKGRR